MPYCVICCISKSKISKEGRITFHKLPQKNVRTQWLKFATDNGISENYLNAKTIFFCSSHFPTTCFKTVKCRTRLQSNAVPSIMIKRKNKEHKSKKKGKKIKAMNSNSNQLINQSALISTCSKFTDKSFNENIICHIKSSPTTVVQGFEKISKSINDDSNQITFNKPLFDKYNSNEEEINQTIRLQRQKVDSMETVTSNCLKKINLENYNTSKLLSDHFEKYKEFSHQESVEANFLINTVDRQFSPTSSIPNINSTIKDGYDKSNVNKDAESIKYPFGWELIGECKLPFILRAINGSYFKYVSKQMIETELLSYYLTFLPSDILSYISIKCHFMSSQEANLFNYINKMYCNQIYRRTEQFQAGKHCIVYVDDVQELYSFIVACYKKIVYNCFPDNGNYGFGVWNKSYIRNSYLSTTLKFIQKYFPPNTNFKKYWPRLLIDKRLYTDQRENISSCSLTVFPLLPNISETRNTYQNGWSAYHKDLAVLQQSSTANNSIAFVPLPPIVKADGTLYWPELQCKQD